MKTFDLKGTLRQEVGKKATKQIRKQGEIPCVLYGGEDMVHFSAPINDFRHLIYTPHVYIVNLDLEGKTYQALVKDLQFHPVTDAILHIDFIQIHEDKPAIARVPVVTSGFAKGVQAGGKLKVELRRLRVKALPKDLPDTLNIDVTNIGLGHSVKVRQLRFDKMELLDPESAVVVSVKLTRAAKGMATRGDGGEEGTEEGAEGAEETGENAEE